MTFDFISGCTTGKVVFSSGSEGMCVLHYSVRDLQHTWDSAGFSSCLLGGATCAEEEEEGAFSLLALGVGGVVAELTLLDSEILSVPEKRAAGC